MAPALASHAWSGALLLARLLAVLRGGGPWASRRCTIAKYISRGKRLHAGCDAAVCSSMLDTMLLKRPTAAKQFSCGLCPACAQARCAARCAALGGVACLTSHLCRKAQRASRSKSLHSALRHRTLTRSKQGASDARTTAVQVSAGLPSALCAFQLCLPMCFDEVLFARQVGACGKAGPEPAAGDQRYSAAAGAGLLAAGKPLERARLRTVTSCWEGCA